MKTLVEFNAERSNMIYEMNIDKPRKNGIACPKCGIELWDSSPMTILTSNPPQMNVHCDCGYVGFRIS